MTSFSRILAVLITLLIAACSSTPPSRAPARPAYKVEADATRHLTPREQVTHWLDLAASTEEIPDKQYYQLMAAELLLREAQLPLADELLKSIDQSVLPAEMQVQYASILARILRNDGEFAKALEVLNAPKLQNMVLLSEIPLQLQISQLRASLYALQGNQLASAQERIYIDPLLNRNQQTTNREGIWNALTHVPTIELMKSHQSAANRDFLGWVELASIAKDNQGDIDTQVRQLDAWLKRWPDHPAAGNLPGGLARLREMATGKAQQIALILPFSGKYAVLGKAIRDGFMTSYFQTRSKGNPTPIIRSYDTEGYLEAGTLYRQALADGAQLVIGPLRKELVDSLVEQTPFFEVPVLALNRSSSTKVPTNLYQFALAPEDEAKQVANIAYNKGYQRALVLTPSNSWGQHVASVFDQHWRELGGQVVGQTTFTPQANDYSQTIKDVMHLDRSEERKQKLTWLIGSGIEFEPRRRDDIDFIFLVARPQEARAIKPLLAYHYAGDIPVLATSHIYSGIAAPDKDHDIDGVTFIDSPWALSDQSPEKQAILRDLPQNQQFQRMYALGVDAYRLYPRLQQMGELRNSRVYGETGSLTLNDKGQIERELLLAVFDEGRAQIIPSIDSTLDRDIHDQTQEAAIPGGRRRN